MRRRALILFPIVILLNVLGNLALSWGMKHAPAAAGPVLSLLEPMVLLGIALLIAWTAVRIALLGVADLSWVLPVTSVGYVLNAVVGAVFLGEHVSAPRWAGTLLIVGGAALVGLATPRERAG